MNPVESEALFKLLGLDLEAFKTVIENINKVEDIEKIFAGLAAIAIAKKIIGEALDQVMSLDSQAKGLINTKAKALYGPDWVVIKGEHFKINRSFSGSVYEVIDAKKAGAVDPDLIKIEFSANRLNVDAFREANDGKLPDGIGANENRQEVIKVTVNKGE